VTLYTTFFSKPILLTVNVKSYIGCI